MKALNKYIDHTNLKPFTTKTDIEKLCADARKWNFASVCVNPCDIALAKELLAGSDVMTCTVIGFPTGAQTPQTKAFETSQAIDHGATEVDMVIDQAAALANDKPTLVRDIGAVVEAAAGHAVVVKVILETAALTDQAKILACEAAMEAGAHYVKTSTGFGPGGATVDDVTLMRSIVGDGIGVKAAGGIRTRQDAIEMLKAGATRLGASATYAIVS